MSKEAKVIAVIFVIIFGGLGWLISRNNKIATTPVAKEQLIKAGNHSTKNPSAKVNLVEFGDYQCPACAAAHPIVEQMLAQYSNNPDVNFVFRNFPLPQHQYALISAEAAEAAGAQGKYWQMHSLLYENQDKWVNSTDPLNIFSGYAAQLQLDVNRFKEDVQQNKYSTVIEADKQDANLLGVNSTPTFFLNGLRMEGIQSISEFKSRVDAELAK